MADSLVRCLTPRNLQVSSTSKNTTQKHPKTSYGEPKCAQSVFLNMVFISANTERSIVKRPKGSQPWKSVDEIWFMEVAKGGGGGGPFSSSFTCGVVGTRSKNQPSLPTVAEWSELRPGHGSLGDLPKVRQDKYRASEPHFRAQGNTHPISRPVTS